MKETKDAANEILRESKNDDGKTLKIWESPKLRILPVPTRTHGGAFTRDDQDDIFYKKS